MKYNEYYICNNEGKSNCVIRSLCKTYNEEYDNVYNELCNISKELDCESFNDIKVFETYIKIELKIKRCLKNALKTLNTNLKLKIGLS